MTWAEGFDGRSCEIGMGLNKTTKSPHGNNSILFPQSAGLALSVVPLREITDAVSSHKTGEVW